MSNLIPAWSSLQPFLPETILVGGMLLVLLIPIFSPRKNALGVGVAAGVVVFLALASLFLINPMSDQAANPYLPTIGGAFFNNLLLMDPFAWFFKLIVLLFLLIVIGLWSLTTRHAMGPGDAPEFFTLLLGAAAGLCLMGSTNNLLMIFLAIEMASLPSYILAGFRKTERLGAEAAMKYVLFGAVCSSIMLFGISLLYGIFGTLDMTQIGQLSQLHHMTLSGTGILFALSTVALLVGVGYKIAMVPMHFWAPDVFEGTHMDVAAFLSVASKAGGLALLLRVVYAFLPPTYAADGSVIPVTLQSGGWLPIGILAIASVTCFWGNLAGLAQNNIKRLLAYSSIAHAGYMMLGIATVAGDMPERGIEGLLFYLFMYLFLNGGAFVVAEAVKQRIGTEDIRQYAGLSRRSPILAACMVVFLFGLVGIPMTVGFGAKLKLFQVLMDSHHWIGYTGLVVLSVNTVIAAFYYFRIIRQMYLVPSDKPAVSEISPITMMAMLLVIPNIGLFVAYGWVDKQVHTFAQMRTLPAHEMTIPAAPKPN